MLLDANIHDNYLLNEISTVKHIKKLLAISNLPTQVGAVRVHVPSEPQVLLDPPMMMYPGLHMYIAVLPGVRPVTLTCPLPGSVRELQVTPVSGIEMLDIIDLIYYKQHDDWHTLTNSVS